MATTKTFEVSFIQGKPELVKADSYEEKNGKCIFQKDGVVVQEFYMHALKSPPKETQDPSELFRKVVSDVAAQKKNKFRRLSR